MGSDADDLLGEPALNVSLKADPADMDVSEDERFDDEIGVKRRPSQRHQTKALLKEVAIPTPKVSASEGRLGRVLLSQSPSSIGSVLSTSRDRSTGYDTPATSAAVTPAESLGQHSFSKPLGNHIGRTLPNSKTMIGMKGKRKREEVDELVEADALLAQALQEEEYEDEMPQRGRPRKTLRKLVDDSDEDSELSEAPQEDPDELEITETMRVRKNNRLSLPTRAARETARKSITAKASREVMDTDDSDDISFTYSDADFDSLEEDIDDDEDQTLPVTSTTAAVAPAPTATPLHRTTPSMRVRRRDPQRANELRQRMRRGMESRVNCIPTVL